MTRASMYENARLLLLSFFFYPLFVFGQGHDYDHVVAMQNDSSFRLMQSIKMEAEDNVPPTKEDDASRSRVNLFLHLDKSIYQPGETLWFTGYVLNRDENLMRKQNTLYVVLVDAVNKNAVIKQRFYIRQGIGKGCIPLADTLNSGDYWLLAYTNAWLEKKGEQPLFRQLISLRTGIATPFKISSQTIENERTDSMRIRYRISTFYRGLASGGTFDYTIFADYDSIASGKLTIDDYGEVVVPFPFTALAGKQAELAVTVRRDSLCRSFVIPLDPSQNQASNSVGQPARHQEQPGVVITTDSSTYHKRSLVTIHIQLKDSLGSPVQGRFSLSVASSRNIDWTRTGNITNPFQNQDLQPASMVDFTDSSGMTTSDAPDYGYVLYKGKTLKKSISLLLMGGKFSALRTDETGKFVLPSKLLVAPSGSRDYLSVTDKEVNHYTIVVHSKAEALNKQLASFHYPLNFTRPVVTADSNNELQQELSPSMMKAAVVKARIIEGYNPLTGEYCSMHCDRDYVSADLHDGYGHSSEVLNSPYSVTGSRPLEGHRYYMVDKDKKDVGKDIFRDGQIAVHVTPAFKTVVYHCAVPPVPPFMTVLQPIQLDKAFPLQNFSSDDSLCLGSGLQSTVYWNHSISTDENGEAVIRFYTNDLAGKFICILQGLSTEGVIFGKNSYAVNP